MKAAIFLSSFLPTVSSIFLTSPVKLSERSRAKMLTTGREPYRQR